MALIRRSGARFSANIWPGFVDAMTAILLVLMFVLSIFMIVQSILRDTITGQNSELRILNVQLDQIKIDLIKEKSKLELLDNQYEQKLLALKEVQKKLNVQEIKNVDLGAELEQKSFKLDKVQANLQNLNSELGILKRQLESKSEQFFSLAARHSVLEGKFVEVSNASEERMALLSALRTKYSESVANVESAEVKIGDLILQNLNLNESLDDTKDTVETEKQKSALLSAALTKARNEIDERLEVARLAAAKVEAFELLIENLKLEKEQLNNEKLEISNTLEKKKLEILQRDKELAIKTSKIEDNEKDKILERAAIEALKNKLAAETEELALTTLNLEAEKQKALKTLELLASARAVRQALENKNKILDKKNISSQEELDVYKIALREARAQLLEDEELIKASALEVSRLNIVSRDLNKKLSELQTILDQSELRDVEKNVQIKVLGGRLNAALARVASEQRKRAEMEAREVERLKLEADDLKNYRSEFFGKLRSILGEKPGIRVVGDRFVFASEVLFETGSAVLGDDGKAQLTEVAKVVRDVSKDIPSALNWILRVDGHTDIVPLAKTSKFSDNWELSQARALSVVKYFIKSEGINAKRLAATGFGEYQPLTNENTPQALARNRRIELKLTEK